MSQASSETILNGWSWVSVWFLHFLAMVMRISCILVGYNSEKFVAACLDSILADAPADTEILFIDNDSRDQTVSLIETHYPQVTLIQNEVNIGHCHATNQGFQMAVGDYIMVLDVDTALEKGVMQKLVDFLDSHPDCSVAAPRMLNSDGSIQETARRFPSVLNALFGRQTLLSRIFPNNPILLKYLDRQNLSQESPFEVGWVSAACMMLPRTTLERFGLWDERFPGYWVDCDWCKTIQEKGGSVYCIPTARVWHYEQNQPNRKKSLSRIRMFNRGASRYYQKHHTWGWWDPRAILGAFILEVRTGMQWLQNLLKPSNPPSSIDVSSHPVKHTP